MPHANFSSNQPLSTPQTIDGVTFEFVTSSRNEQKICTHYKNKTFLLTKKNKDHKSLIKADKITRVTPINIIKEAINAYTKATDALIISSNTNVQSQKVEPHDEYLKEIDFFVNEFDTDKEIWIEIGFGSGRHLLHQAKNNPDIQFIGLEIHTPSIEQMLKQVRIEKIENILAVDYDARLFMEFIKSNKVGRIFVHFPVPWDKKPHRRIYSQAFIDEALRVLKPSGTLELRTDSRKYFDYCTELLTTQNSGHIEIDINKDLAISSKYEDRWKKQGKAIYDVVLTCQENSDDRTIEIDFNFPKPINFEKLQKQLDSKALIGDNFVVHFEELYSDDDNTRHLLQLTLGNFSRTVSKYIFIDGDQASYFQGNPIPTSSNLDAHKLICEVICDD